MNSSRVIGKTSTRITSRVAVNALGGGSLRSYQRPITSGVEVAFSALYTGCSPAESGVVVILFTHRRSWRQSPTLHPLAVSLGFTPRQLGVVAQ